MGRCMLLFGLVGALWMRPLLAQTDQEQAPLSEMQRYFDQQRQSGHLQEAGPLLLFVRPSGAPEVDQALLENIVGILAEIVSPEDIRVCAACMRPRTQVQTNRAQRHTAPPTLTELATLDAQLRGGAPPAHLVLVVQRLGPEIALQIYRLQNGSLLASELFTGRKRETQQMALRLPYREGIKQKARGWGLTHWVVDAVVYPNAHFGMDVLDQVGEYRNHLIGVSTSMWNPLLGAGVAYHYVLQDYWNATVGAKLLLSMPTLIAKGLADDFQTGVGFEPTFTPVLMARVPIPNTPLTLSAMASVSVDVGAVRLPQVGIGLSLVDLFPAPVLP